MSTPTHEIRGTRGQPGVASWRMRGPLALAWQTLSEVTPGLPALAGLVQTKRTIWLPQSCSEVGCVKLLSLGEVCYPALVNRTLSLPSPFREKNWWVPQGLGRLGQTGRGCVLGPKGTDHGLSNSRLTSDHHSATC